MPVNIQIRNSDGTSLPLVRIYWWLCLVEVSYFVHLLSNLEEYRHNIKAKTLPIYKASLKFGENRRNIYLKDLRWYKERTSRWMSLCLIALGSNANLPDLAIREDGWEVESVSVPFEVLLVWNHSTSRQGRVYCSKVGGH